MQDHQLAYFIEPWRKKVGGISRSLVYELIAAGEIETAKIAGRRVIVTQPDDFVQRRIEKRGEL
jgi:hypothetical protein